MTTDSLLRLAIAQTPGELETPAERLSWLSDTLLALIGQQVDLLLLPELFACGYHIGEAIRTWAEPQEGPTAQAMADLARKHGVAIHYGYAETSGAHIYNAAQCFSSEGQRLSHHRKLAIPPGFERDYFSAGAGCSLFELCGIRIATLICYDAEFPETVRHVAAKGAHLVLVPTALSENWPIVADKLMPARAFENGVFIAYANHAGIEQGLRYLGRSVIAGPTGEKLAKAGSKPDILLADIDASKVKAAQQRLPYLQDRHALSLD